MSNIFKVFHITKEEVKQCFVFIGNVRGHEDIETKDLSELFEKNPEHQIFETIFTDEQKQEIQTK